MKVFSSCLRAMLVLGVISPMAAADLPATVSLSDAPVIRDVIASETDDQAAYGSLVSESIGDLVTSETTHSGCDCAQECCDCAKLQALTKAVAGSHKGLYYNNTFDYLCDPCYDDWWPGDWFKRRCIGGWGVLDVGGQYRIRYHREQNMRGLGLTGVDDSFLLHRTRLYANLEVGSRFRFYAEMLDAVSNYENFGPRPIEESRLNLQNGFGDVMLWDNGCGELWARIGRQELLYAQQRVITPLDWANTRRTFEGGKLFWQGQNWDVDAFWTHPVSPAGSDFQSTDDSQEFSGVWSTYKARENEKIHAFFLRYIETDGARFQHNTFGLAYKGSRNNWLWDMWGAYQFGDVQGANQSTFAYTVGFGRKFECLPWSPTVWGYFDWAEGDDRQGLGYHHMFPLAHKYLGFMDFFGRRNIEDVNVLVTLQPTDKLKLLAWGHIFHLQNSNDVPYNVTMTPFVATPGGSAELGQELDFIASYDINPRLNVLLGYSHFFAGEFYRTNPSPPPYAGDADFFYAQMAFDF